MSEYRAWFSCAAGCPGEHSLSEVIYRCPSCGGLLEVVHDVDALRAPLGGRVDAALRRALPAHRLAVRQRRVGQEGVGAPGPRRRERRVDLRRRHQPLLGRALRRELGRRRPVDQAVRQLATPARSRTSA